MIRKIKNNMANKVKFSEEEIEDLRKSLKDLEFSNEEIEEMVNKAVQMDISKSEDESEEEEEEGKEKESDEENEGSETEEDENEMKKAFDDIKKMKSELDKAMDTFLDRFGNVPGFNKPDFDIKNKGIDNDIEKAFGSEKLNMIEKSFEKQEEVNSNILKSLDALKESVNQIANAPNPLKSLLGDYSGSIIQKGERTDENGKSVINVSNKKAVQEVLLKSLDVLKEEDHKQLVRDEISNFTVVNKLNPKTLNIVSKAMNVEFEK